MSKSKHGTNSTNLKVNKRLAKWLDSFEKVSAAVDRHDLLQLLEEGGGICKIENFLPTFVAEDIMEALEQFTEADWNVSCWATALTVLAMTNTTHHCACSGSWSSECCGCCCGCSVYIHTCLTS
jgi:hypothetical protein